MRHELPQFINVEDKIFGPFTFKQFVYLAGGAGLSYLLWQILPTIIAIIFIIPVVVLSLALSFYKINNRPFIYFLQAMFTHGMKSKFYLWQHRKVQPKKPQSENKQTNQTVLENLEENPLFQDSKLNNIAWSLDVLDMNDPNANRDRKD